MEGWREGGERVGEGGTDGGKEERRKGGRTILFNVYHVGGGLAPAAGVRCGDAATSVTRSNVPCP